MSQLRIQRDTRGLGVGIMGFVAILVIGALLYTMLADPAFAIFDAAASQTSNEQAEAAIETREQIFGNVLIYVMFLSGLFIIAVSVFESRVR